MKTTLRLYRLHDLAYRTQYAEVTERANAAGTLLLGTPGTLYKRDGTGQAYWYRVYYPIPGKQAEEFVGTADNETARVTMSERIAHAQWTVEQISNLRKLRYQVADKSVGNVLVELYNRKVLEAGLVVVGTLAYMSWLNEYGAMAVAARTQDLDLARRQHLKLAAPTPFMDSIKRTQLPFHPIPGMPSSAPPTSVKLPGRDGLRVDILAPGQELGKIIQIPELQWHAQTVPYYDYLLEDPQHAAMLAGGHCIPIALPRVDRMIWHKLYASATRTRTPAKAEKDLQQAATLAAIVVEQDGQSLGPSLAEAPVKLQNAVRARLPRLLAKLDAHPEARDALRLLLA
jgi:hypothetical protein